MSDSILNHDTDREVNSASPNNRNKLQLERLGYILKQRLYFLWNKFEGTSASFCTLATIGDVRTYFYLGMLAGGPLAMLINYIIAVLFTWITAGVLAEICSALPLRGGIYLWAIRAAGPKYARLVAFIVAWWVTSSWVILGAANSQVISNYLLSLVPAWEIDFPGGIAFDNLKWRAISWGLSEGLLLVAMIPSYLSPQAQLALFKFDIGLMTLDFFLCLIWLPLKARGTNEYRNEFEWVMPYNGTGALEGWNWMLGFLFTALTLSGFSAPGDIVEETKDSGVVGERGILSSAVTSGIFGFITTIVFLFCTPDAESWYYLDAPQPFVLVYLRRLGPGGATFMTILAVITQILNTAFSFITASRLMFLIARDRVLPLSGWIGRVTANGRPQNALIVIYTFSAVLLCTILVSPVAFTSLVSAACIPNVLIYALIALLRLMVTPNGFESAKFSLGRLARPAYLATFGFNMVIFAVFISPFDFPVTIQNFNFAGVIIAGVTILGLLKWRFTPKGKWLRTYHEKLYGGEAHTMAQYLG